MKWLNEAPTWRENGNTLSVTTGMGADFWRVTFYDFVRDPGHFYFDTITGDFSGEAYYLLRLAPFPAIGRSLVGIMCCSPKRAGFQAHFSDFRIGPPISKELHA
jgi:regulation of enolase protein 1 (concanavalin A-like superfamily)